MRSVYQAPLERRRLVAVDFERSDFFAFASFVAAPAFLSEALCAAGRGANGAAVSRAKQITGKKRKMESRELGGLGMYSTRYRRNTRRDCKGGDIIEVNGAG